MSNTFFTSDCHFGHENSIKYCNRPFKTAAQMNTAMIGNWNDTVTDKDDVYSLGDFAFMPFDEIVKVLRQLKGKHRMILGNHCHQIAKNKRFLLDEGLVERIDKYDEISVPYNDKGETKKQKICLFHYPQRAWNGSHYGSWQLFGHVHGTMEPYGRSVDVGVDAPFVLGTAVYRPFSFEEIFEYMKNREIIKDFD